MNIPCHHLRCNSRTSLAFYDVTSCVISLIPLPLTCMIRICVSVFIYLSWLGTQQRSLESHPISLSAKAWNTSAGSPFVNISANCSVVSTLRTQMSSPICWQKKWYLIVFGPSADLRWICSQRKGPIIVFPHTCFYYGLGGELQVKLGTDFKQ